MKKVLFIEPPPTLDWTVNSNISKAGRRHPSLNKTGEQVYSYQNLSCAAVLRNNNYDVFYYHCSTQELDLTVTKEKINFLMPYAVIIMIEHINKKVSEDISKFVHSLGIYVVWVGPFVTAFHKKEIKNEYVDFIIRKEWDITVLNLLNALRLKRSLSDVNGLTWKDKNEGVVINNEASLIENLDELPLPAYDLLDLKKFYESVFIHYPAATMITSRGCPFHCVYCSYPQTIYSHIFRAMSPERVVKEIRYLVNDLGVKEIRIDDDTFNINEKRAIDICKLIIEEFGKVCFSVQVRPQLLTEELAHWLKNAGCRMVLFGVESGNEEVLKKIKKGATKDDIRRGVKIAKKCRLDILNCIMIGFYWDTKETIEDSMQFVCELNAEFTQFSTPTPLPGTEYYKVLDENNCFITREWEQHDSFHHSSVKLPYLSNDDINNFFKTCYRRYYHRPRYLLMMFLRMFRSWGNFIQSLKKFNVLFTK